MFRFFECLMLCFYIIVMHCFRSVFAGSSVMILVHYYTGHSVIPSWMLLNWFKLVVFFQHKQKTFYQRSQIRVFLAPIIAYTTNNCSLYPWSLLKELYGNYTDTGMLWQTSLYRVYILFDFRGVSVTSIILGENKFEWEKKHITL